MDDILSGLNEAQRYAVTSEASVLQVLAPPGSGKTKTLTARVGYLIKVRGLQPRNIVVCTFTIKAATEMKERITGFLGKDIASKLILGTFHSISRRYLAAHGKEIGLDPKFGIADSSDTMSILTRIIKRLGINLNPAQARARISTIKSQGQNADQFAHSSKKADQQEIAILYAEYEDHLKVSNLLDFDDLLMRFVELIRRFPLCVADVEALLIDEFQDTNNIQYDLMTLMAQHRQAITVVGDPDQSIYGWRNAQILNLKKMISHYPETSTINLEKNYRSAGAILLAAQEIIEQDSSRPLKQLVPTHSFGLRPVLRKLPSAGAEAQWIVSEIKRSLALSGKLLTFRDFAILLRSASLSRHIESVLGKEGIPYRMVGGHKFFDRLEVRLVLDYLRVLSRPNHNDALARIINVPPRKIGDVTIQRLLEHADAKRIPLWTLVLGVAQGRVESTNLVSSHSRKGLELFVNLILTAQKRLEDTSQKSMDIDEFVTYLISKVKISEFLKKTKPEEFDSRWANVQELIALAADFSVAVANDSSNLSNDGITNLQGVDTELPRSTEEALSVFLGNVALSTEVEKGDEDLKDKEQVTISTIHAAKGLEFPVVFIPAAYEGSIPHSRAEDIDEERRLLFVGMTRAQSLLYISNPKSSSTGERTTLSPFLADGSTQSYFDNRGPRFDFSVSSEIATILRRGEPDKKSVERAFLSVERIEDDLWPTGGEEEESEVEKREMNDRNDRNDTGGWRYLSTGHQPSSLQKGAPIRLHSEQGKHTGITTMGNVKHFSTTTTTISTSFISASAALSTLNQTDLNGTEQRRSSASKAPTPAVPKRKADQLSQEGSGQQTLIGFFTKPRSSETNLQQQGLGIFQQQRSGAIQSGKHFQLPGQLMSSQPEVGPVERSEAVIPTSNGMTNKSETTPRPSTSLHHTSIQQMSAAAPKKRTLGVRRSLNGWNGRNTQAPAPLARREA